MQKMTDADLIIKKSINVFHPIFANFVICGNKSPRYTVHWVTIIYELCSEYRYRFYEIRNYLQIFSPRTCVYDNIPTGFGIDADNSLNLEYKGQQLPDDCSFLTIKGTYKGIHDKRVLCVEPLVFVDPNCAISITFTMSSSQQLVIPYDGVIIWLSKSTLDLKDGTSTLMIHIK